MKKFANKIVNLDYSPQIAIQKLKQDFLELSTVLDSAYSYLSQLTSYQKQYYGSYLSVSSTLGFIGPGKLKGTKSLQKVASKASEVVGVGAGKKLLGKYKNFECEPFGDYFRSLLRKEGVEYRDVKIVANAKFIYSDSAKNIFPNDLGAISTNGYHSATRVGDMVYDNVHPTGISIADFKKDLAIGQYNYYAIVDGLD